MLGAIRADPVGTCRHFASGATSPDTSYMQRPLNDSGSPTFIYVFTYSIVFFSPIHPPSFISFIAPFFTPCTLHISVFLCPKLHFIPPLLPFLSVSRFPHTAAIYTWRPQISIRIPIYDARGSDILNSTDVSLTLNIPRGVLRGPPLVCYWLTSVEINKHKIFDTNNA